MRPTIWADVKRVFGDAADLPHDEQERFVDAAVSSPHVRAEVMRLLSRSNAKTAFLERRASLRARAAPTPPPTSVGPDGRSHPATTSAESPLPPAPPRLAPGARLVGRYVLGRQIGRGAFGAVHVAKDELTGQDVAVKLIDLDGESDQSAMRREVAVLRRARLPGLVELLDDGIEMNQAFLVMRLVDGKPFPGDVAHVAAAADRTLGDAAMPTYRWQDLGPRAVALCDALGRLHWLGVLHRDLKPSNVLVDAQGVATIVDFGIARDIGGFGDAAAGYLAGTPPYIAPERICSVAPGTETVASDLYSVGVILYELLSGRTPRAADSIEELVRVSATPVPPLRDVAPDVPAHVAETVDALLQADPALRPKSARLVAALLRGEGEDGARIQLPYVGSDVAVQAVIDAVKSKRPLDLCGPAGVGRTRTLEEADRRLTAEGYRVLWCRPATDRTTTSVAAAAAPVSPFTATPFAATPFAATSAASTSAAAASPAASSSSVVNTARVAAARPFDSLVPVVGEMPDDPDLTLDDLRRWLRRCLHFWLDVHVCVIADDWTAIDPHTREVLESVRGSGPLVRVFDGAPGTAGTTSSPWPVPPDALEVLPRTELELRDLFHGPDRIFHLREDGARELHRRTAGVPGDCVREFETWVDNGVARWEEGRCRVDREGLEKLESGNALALPVARETTHSRPGATLDVAAALELAGCALTATCVGEVLSISRWQAEAELQRLASAGMARVCEDGRFAAVSAIGAAAPWTGERRRNAHGVIADALDSPSESRLKHLELAGRTVDAASEALRLTRAHLDAGRHERALGVGSTALRAIARGDVPAGVVDQLRGLVADAALQIGAPEALQRALAAVSRDAHVAFASPEPVLRSALDALAGRSLPAAAALADRAADLDTANARRHLAVAAVAARRSADAGLRRGVLARVARWARTAREPVSRCLHLECLAWERYAGGRFDAAAALHRRAARRHRSLSSRVSASLNAASAELELGLLDEARRTVDRALAELGRIRMPLHEARAALLSRAAAYRAGVRDAPDLELVDAASRNIPQDLAGRIALTEAAFAWRNGNLAAATCLAERAERALSACGLRAGATLAAALRASASVGAIDARHLPAPATDATLPPRIRAQAVALTAALAVRHDRTPDCHFSGPRRGRMEVLDVAEVATRLGAAP